MLYQRQGILVQICSLFTALLLLLVACGQSPQTASSTPVVTPTAGEQNLQATVNTLQTQLALQSTSVPTTISTEIPAATTLPVTAATEAPSATKNPFIGKWEYNTTTLDGQPEQYGSSAPAKSFEFFDDNSVEIIDFQGEQVKSSYTLSEGNTRVKIAALRLVNDGSIEGDKLIFRYDVQPARVNAPTQKEEIIYTQVKSSAVAPTVTTLATTTTGVNISGTETPPSCPRDSLRVLNADVGFVTSVAFSPDGKTLASGGNDKSPKLWDVASGQELRTLSGHTGTVSHVVFSPDGKTLASAGFRDQTVKLWDVASGQEIRTLNVNTDVLGLAFSPDGTTLASESGGNIVKLWDVANGQELRTLNVHVTNVVPDLDFSPDGKTLAIATYSDKTVELWDVASGQELRTLSGHMGDVVHVAFSPDGKTLASNYDKTERLWDVASGRALRTLSGYMDVVWDVAFSPDGKTLASTSLDNTIKLWDVASGQELCTITENHPLGGAVAFSPDGNILASGGSKNKVVLWKIK